MILLIDNYDSFVYNLARYVAELGFAFQVVRNDAMTIAEIAQLQPSHIILSPGPCTPDQAGISLAVIQHLAGSIPLLGVCLGHQAIGQAYGGQVVRAQYPMHGKASLITHHGQDIFTALAQPLRVARYHSLVVSPDDFPSVLEVTACCEKGEIMALRHRTQAVFGVQFHPESILTEQGHALLLNFLGSASNLLIRSP